MTEEEFDARFPDYVIAEELMTCDYCGEYIWGGDYYISDKGGGKYCDESCWHKSLGASGPGEAGHGDLFTNDI